MGKSKKFKPKIYYLGVWRLLKNDFLVFLLKLGAEIFRAGLWFASLVFIAVVLAVGMGSGLDHSMEGVALLTGFLGEAVRVLSQPVAWAGIAGLLAGTWALSLCVDSLALAGVWGVLGERVAGRAAPGRPGPSRRRFGGAVELWQHATRHFARVLQLQVLGLAAQALVLLTSLMTLAAIFSATTGHGALSGAPLVVRALLWALPCTLLSALALLTRLSVELAAAPLILEGQNPGVALLDAATLIIRRFVEVYRLFLFAATLLLLPLSFYWVLLIAQNFAVNTPALLPVFAMIRMVADAILFASAGVISVFFKGAIFSFYHDLISGHKMTDDASSPDPANPPTSLHSTRLSMTRQTKLEDFLPRTYPNIVRIDALISPRDAQPEDAQPSDADQLHDLAAGGAPEKTPGDPSQPQESKNVTPENAAPENAAPSTPPPLPGADDLSGVDIFDPDSDDLDRD